MPTLRRERFPKLPVIWIEGGLAWIPFLMQRLDHEYMLRSSEYPLLKKKPSDAARLFKLPPCNERQKENLQRFGNAA